MTFMREIFGLEPSAKLPIDDCWEIVYSDGAEIPENLIDINNGDEDPTPAMDPTQLPSDGDDISLGAFSLSELIDCSDVAEEVDLLTANFHNATTEDELNAAGDALLAADDARREAEAALREDAIAQEKFGPDEDLSVNLAVLVIRFTNNQNTSIHALNDLYKLYEGGVKNYMANAREGIENRSSVPVDLLPICEYYSIPVVPC